MTDKSKDAMTAWRGVPGFNDTEIYELEHTFVWPPKYAPTDAHRMMATICLMQQRLASRSAATEVESEPDVQALAGRLARTADAIENPSPAQQKFGAAMHEIAAAPPFDWEKRDELRRRIAEPSERPSEGRERICPVLRATGLHDADCRHPWHGDRTAGTAPDALSDLRTVSAELLRLWKWRKALGKREEFLTAQVGDNNESWRELRKDLLKYGREKAAAWARLEEVLSRGAGQ